MAATARLELRVRPDTKSRLERAAALAQVPVSDFRAFVRGGSG